MPEFDAGKIRIPDGYELVGIGGYRHGDMILGDLGRIITAVSDLPDAMRVIVRKAEPPPPKMVPYDRASWPGWTWVRFVSLNSEEAIYRVAPDGVTIVGRFVSWEKLHDEYEVANSCNGPWHKPEREET